MTDSVPTTRRWRRGALLAALAAGGVASSALLSAGHQASLPAKVRLAAASAPGAGGADRAAVNYVDSHYPGPGTAQMLKSEPDVDRDLPVYDVRVIAPNGTTYVIHVRQSNDAVLFTNRAERQMTPPPTTATEAPAASPAATNPPPTTEPLQAPEPVERPETPAARGSAARGSGASLSGHSPDRSGSSTGTSSQDHTKAPTSRRDN